MAGKTTKLALHRPGVGHEASFASRMNDNADTVAEKLGTQRLERLIPGFNASVDHYIATARKAGKVSAAGMVSSVATTGSSGSIKWDFVVKNLTRNKTIATGTTNAAELAADTKKALTLSATADDLVVNAGDVIELQITKTSTATDLSGASVLAWIDLDLD